MISLRFATFNVALYRDRAGGLIADFATPANPQAQAIAEIIQRVRPDVLLLNEFDYDAEAQALTFFQQHYLERSQNGRPPLRYRHRLASPSNTGVAIFDSNDAHGYGAFPGQYAFALLARYPLQKARVRTLQTFRWRAMPAAKLRPDDYPPQALELQRLSSKNHVDVPLLLPNGTLIHVLACHPTPPLESPNARNARRNFDEIRLLADYITPARSGYLVDDSGVRGGLPAGAHFVIMGDLNADPVHGNSLDGAIQQLLEHPAIDHAVADGPATAEFNGQRLRVDYVLPSASLTVSGSGVFWPAPGDELHRLVAGNLSSDHRLVWVDIVMP